MTNDMKVTGHWSFAISVNNQLRFFEQMKTAGKDY